MAAKERKERKKNTAPKPQPPMAPSLSSLRSLRPNFRALGNPSGDAPVRVSLKPIGHKERREHRDQASGRDALLCALCVLSRQKFATASPPPNVDLAASPPAHPREELIGSKPDWPRKNARSAKKYRPEPPMAPSLSSLRSLWLNFRALGNPSGEAPVRVSPKPVSHKERREHRDRGIRRGGLALRSLRSFAAKISGAL